MAESTERLSARERASLSPCPYCGGRRAYTWGYRAPPQADHSRCAVLAGHVETDPNDPDLPFNRWQKAARLRHQGWTLESIGRELNVTRERVRQILARPKPPPVVTVPMLNGSDVWAVSKQLHVLDAIAACSDADTT